MVRLIMVDAPAIRCLSIRQPWPWAIIAGHKDVENRPWRFMAPAPLLIHAGLRHDSQGELSLRLLGIEPPDEPVAGAIIGMVTVTGVSADSQSPWALPGY